MIDGNKNIDQLFRDKLSDFEKTPPAYVWDDLQKVLTAGKRKKVVMYWRLGGVAASLLIAFLLVWQFNRDLVLNPEIIVENVPSQILPSGTGAEDDKEEIILPEQFEEKKIETTNIVVKMSQADAKAQNISVPASLTTQTSILNREEVPDFIKSLQAIFKLPEIETQRLAIDRSLFKTSVFSPEELRIIEENKSLLAMNTSDERQKKMIVGASVSPVYYIDGISHSEDYSANMTTSNSSNNVNMGGGFSFEYKTKSKWSFQSGIYYNKLEQSSSNTVPKASASLNDPLSDNLSNFFSTPVQEKNGILKMNSVAGVIQIDNLPSSVQLAGTLDSESYRSPVLLSDATFDQNFEYLEIPLFIKYQLLESKIDVQLLSGVSTNILIGNNVYLRDDVEKTNVGKTEGMVNFNYSGVLGFGFNYALASNLYLSIEPRMKYFFNSLNEDGNVNYRPFSFGVYTGISYAF